MPLAPQTDDPWFQLIPLGVVIQDVGGEVLRFNQAAADLLGATDDQMAQWNPLAPPVSLVQEDLTPLPPASHPFHRVVNTGHSVRDEIVGVLPVVGSVSRWLLVSSLPYKTPGQGGVSQICTTLQDITRWKTLQDQLVRERPWWAGGPILVPPGSCQGTWAWSAATGILIGDETWAHDLGLSPLERAVMTWEGWRVFIHPQDVDSWDSLLASVLAGTRASFDIQIRQRNRSGPWVWFRIRGLVCEKHTDEKPARILGIQENITELVHAKEEWSVLSQVVQQGPSAVILTDVEGIIEYVNNQFTVLTGYRPAEVRGQNVRILQSPNMPKKVIADLWRTLGSGRPWFGEFPAIRKGGDSYWAQASVAPILDPTGRVTRYMGQELDITSRKHAEEAAQAQYQFQIFLTQVSARLVHVDQHSIPRALREILGDLGRLFEADRVGLRLLSEDGHVLESLGEWSEIKSSVPASVPLTETPEWKERITSREPFRSAGMSCRVPWSTRPAASLLSVPVEGGQGQPGALILESSASKPEWSAHVQVSVMVVANIVSEFLKRTADEERLRRAQREAEAANRTKSEFLAHISHEIRTPMSGILGLAELALERNSDPEVRSLVESIRSSGEALLALVNDILDVSKIEAGKIELETVAFSVTQMVRATLAPLRVLAQKKGLALHFAEPVVIEDWRMGDPTRLRQVLTNLVGNAVKFTAQGTVTVTVENGGPPPRDDTVRFVVRDTGPGVPLDRRHKLFQRFSQTESWITRQYGGTGLGLAISRELVERMGGSIGYEDAVNPAGGIFSFTASLPIATKDRPADPPEAPSVGSLSGKGWRVLVVEDNVVNQQVAVGLLKKWGVTTTLASHGAEALELLANGAFDLVLMDVQMPIMDGYTATRAIRKGFGGENHRQIPIVAMTANAMQGDREACLDAGMDGYLSKPISANQFAQLLQTWGPGSPSRPAAHPVARIFDPEEMRSRLQLENELVVQIIRTFYENLPARRKALIDAHQAANYREVMRLAHTLKGTAANLVAQGVMESAQALEQASKAEDSTQIDAAQSVLLEEIDRLEVALAQFLSENPPPRPH